MQKTEAKILKKIYGYETKKTIAGVIFESLGLAFLIIGFLLFGWVIVDILKEQKTFDLLQIFGEDPEVMRKYFFETISIFYWEIPKELMIIFLLFSGSLVLLISVIIRNFSRMKNKIISLVKYYFKKI